MDQGPVGRDADLPGLVLAEGCIGVEGLIGIIGAGLGRQDVDHDVRAGLLVQDDAPRVGHRRLGKVVLVVVRDRRRRSIRHPRSDFVDAVEQRDIRPIVETDDIEVVGLRLRIVVGHGRGLPRPPALHHLQCLAGQLHGILVYIVALNRNDQLVFESAPDALIHILGEELVVGDDGGHAHGVSRTGRGMVDRSIEERIVGGRAALIDDDSHTGRVLGGRTHQNIVGGIHGLVGARIHQFQPRTDGVSHLLEDGDGDIYRVVVVGRDEAQESAVDHVPVSHQDLLITGQDIEAAGHEAGLVDVGNHAHVAAALAAEGDGIDTVLVRGDNVRHLLFEDADIRCRAGRPQYRYRAVEIAFGVDFRRQPCCHGVEVALARLCPRERCPRQGVLERLAVENDLEHFAGGYRLEAPVEFDHDLEIMIRQGRILERGRAAVWGIARPRDVTDRHKGSALGDLDRAIDIGNSSEGGVCVLDCGSQEVLEVVRCKDRSRQGAVFDDVGLGCAAKLERPHIARRVVGRVIGRVRVGSDNHLPVEVHCSADRRGAGHGQCRYAACRRACGAPEQNLAVEIDRLVRQLRADARQQGCQSVGEVGGTEGGNVPDARTGSAG